MTPFLSQLLLAVLVTLAVIWTVQAIDKHH